MDQLIKALPRLLQETGDAEEVMEAAALAVWKHVAGEGLRQHAVPFRLHKKTLTVAVADSVWQKQLESMAGQLIFRLNSLLGQAAVTFIEFRVDPATVASAREGRAEIKQRAAAAEVASEPIPFELVSAAASIHDTDLRRAFLGAASSCIRRLEKQQCQ